MWEGENGVYRDQEPGGDPRGTTRVVTYSDKKTQRKTTVASTDTLLEPAKLDTILDDVKDTARVDVASVKDKLDADTSTGRRRQVGLLGG